MAIYHLSVKIGGRAKGQSAIAASAYRSGEKLKDYETGLTSDYSRKQRVVCCGIALCENAPEEYVNRETLWNAVHKIEKSKDARLWREIEVALPRELKQNEQIATVKEFVSYLTEKGMCADWAIHDSSDGNPHAHIMLTTRSILPNGKWAGKSRKVYDLDENGQRIFQKIDKTGRKQYKCHTESYNNWNDKERVEEWRAFWAECCNARLSEQDRIDHRSYERQGKEQIPTIHEGYYARKIASQGRNSELVSRNDEIRQQNSLLEEIENQVNAIESEIQQLTAEEQDKINVYLSGFQELCRSKPKQEQSTSEKSQTQTISQEEIERIIQLRNDYAFKCSVYYYLKTAHISTECQESYQNAQQMVQEFRQLAKKVQELNDQIKKTINPFKKRHLRDERNNVAMQLERTSNSLKSELDITLVYERHDLDCYSAPKDHINAIIGYTKHPISMKKDSMDSEIKRNEMIQELMQKKITDEDVHTALTSFQNACKSVPDEEQQRIYIALINDKIPNFDFEVRGYLSKGRQIATKNIGKIVSELKPLVIQSQLKQVQEYEQETEISTPHRYFGHMI